MKRIRNFSLIRWLALALMVSALLLLVFQLVVFSRLRSSFATGSVIAGVDVSGLDVDQAADRLTQVYSVPVELRYGDSAFQVKPATLGFSLNLSSMIAAADQARAALPFWSAFWDYLFNKMPESQEIPIMADIDVNQMRTFLVNEVASRYDQDPEPFSPIPGEVFFTAGKSGMALNVDRSIELISMALKSPSDRVINLSVEKSTSSRPSIENLKVLLSQIIDTNDYTGIAEIYMLDLQTGQEMQLAYQAGERLTPDIAFSAQSSIKTAVMTEVYRIKNEPIDQDTFTLLEKMMTISDNDATDALMSSVMEPNLGPLYVTDTLKKLGLNNTFLSGMFYYGAPLLKPITTTANSRVDVNVSMYLDQMNQTTPAEIGSLLADIYQCAQTGGGTLAVVFQGQVSQNECRAMISLLAKDRIGMLIEAGLPDGTQIAHKHGWTTNDYIIHNMCDTAIVYTPGGNYILTIFLYDENQIVFDNGNALFSDLSRAIYNYFNIGSY